VAQAGTHAWPTTAICVGYVLAEGAPQSFDDKKVIILLLIWFLGQLMDFFDHLSVARVRRLLAGDNRPIEGHVNWMHTLSSMSLVCTLSVLMFNCWGWQGLLPALSYLVHIIMDSAGIEKYDNSPLPRAIHRRFFDEGKIFHRFSYKAKSLKL
jgi:hypothetical protein